MTIKDVRNFSRIKTEIDNTTIKGIKNFCILKKENEAIKDRIIKDIRKLFKREEEEYYKPV